MSTGLYTHLASGGKKEPFILRVDTTLGDGVNKIIITLIGTNMRVDWGDGTTETITNGSGTTDIEHYYSVGGIYDISVSSLEKILYSNKPDVLKPIKVVQWGEYVWQGFDSSFSGCLNLEMSLNEKINMEGDISFRNLSANTKEVATISPVFFENAVNNHDFRGTFYRTNILDGTLRSGTFANTPNVTTFLDCFRESGLTTVEAGVFDNVTTTNYTRTFVTNALTQQSVDNIVVSINTARVAGIQIGTTKKIDIRGGGNASPSQVGKDAIDALRGDGWTVLLDGY